MREGTETDAVDGVVPRFVAEPASAQEVADTLVHAGQNNLSILTRGAGTKMNWGPPLQQIDLLLSTARLNKVVAHRHGDLTVTVEAGAPLGDVNRELAAHRQWIPLDPYFGDRATIGGTVATNDSGPRRHRYGSPRDLIIGVEFARADGGLTKGGGIVVKNVAGYDLPRLMTGSFGSLGIILTASFKLYPLTSSSRTIAVDLSHPRDLGTLTGKILSSHLTPTALEFQASPLRLLVRFESIESAVEQQTASCQKLVEAAGFSSTTVTGDHERQLWEEHGKPKSHGAAVKVSTLPTELSAALSLIDETAGAGRYSASGRAGLGVFVVHVDGDTALVKNVVSRLRESLPAGRGSAVLMKGSVELRKVVDVWGSIGDGLGVMKAVKAQFDPRQMLNRGRGPGGL